MSHFPEEPDLQALIDLEVEELLGGAGLLDGLMHDREAMIAVHNLLISVPLAVEDDEPLLREPPVQDWKHPIPARSRTGAAPSAGTRARLRAKRKKR